MDRNVPKTIRKGDEMSEMEQAYHAMMGGSIYDCIKWIRLTSGSEAMPYVADLIESEINVRNDQIAALKKELKELRVPNDSRIQHARNLASERDAALKELEEAKTTLKNDRHDLMVRGDAYMHEVDACKEDVLSLRAAMIYAINHAGWAVTDDCSTDFLCMGADQIKLFIDKLKKELEIARGEREAMRKALDEIGCEHLGGNEQAELARETLKSLPERPTNEPSKKDEKCSCESYEWGPETYTNKIYTCDKCGKRYHWIDSPSISVLGWSPLPEGPKS